MRGARGRETSGRTRCGPRRRAVDQLDLVLCLRDLLRDRPDVRRQFQGLFDHVFVDEFQDTDPLQAEIVLYLCARAEGDGWGESEGTGGGEGGGIGGGAPDVIAPGK